MLESFGRNVSYVSYKLHKNTCKNIRMHIHMYKCILVFL